MGSLLLLLAACAPGDSRREPAAAAETAEEEPESVPGAPDPSDAVFDVETVHRFALEMDAAAWADVVGNPWAETWHAATFRARIDGEVEVVEGVSVRAFGAGSMIAGKPALKISFEREAPGQRWRGLEELKLDNSSQDAGYMNERIGTAAVRRWDLPAARTGWVDLEVNGDAAGFFVLLESVDDRFVARHYDLDDGVLYGMNSGYWGQGLNPMTDPLTWYEPQTNAEGADGASIVEAARLLAEGTDAEVAAAIDLDGFTRVSVARSIMGGIDTFSADGNNFYLYDDGEVLHTIPWDLDADLGYPWYFTTALAVDPNAPWLTSPWAYNAVTGAAYTDPVLTRHVEMGEDLGALVAEALAGPLEWSRMDAEVEASAALIRDYVMADVLGYGSAFGPRVADLRLFLHARASRLLGRDAADCTDPPDDVVLARDLSPTGTVGWGTLQVDGTDWGPGFTIGGDHYCTGLFAHAPSDVTVQVPDGFTVLEGAVGLQVWQQQCGDGARFEVWQEGALLWRSGVLASYAEAEEIGGIAVSAGEVRLVTTVEGEYSCDTTVWAELAVGR